MNNEFPNSENKLNTDNSTQTSPENISDESLHELPLTETPLSEESPLPTDAPAESCEQKAEPVTEAQPVYREYVHEPQYAQPKYTEESNPQATAPYTTPPTQPNYGYTQPPIPPERPPYPGYYPVAPAPKKGGINALFVCLWVLVALFALGFFGICGYIIGSNSNSSAPVVSENAQQNVPTLFNEDEDKSEEKDKDKSEKDKESKPSETTPDEEKKPESTKDNDVVAMPENDENLYSDNTKIILNKLPKDYTDSDKYTTQYAYNQVSNFTIGIVCYEEGFSDEPASEGTGIIVSSDGYVATNSHVIGDSRSLYDVKVVTGDGTIYEAKVIGFDSRTDLAVLKINAKNLPCATFCDSEYVEVGQDVIAVGNPGGIEFQNSLTRGVVSAVNRELSLSSQVSYIQTDAAINPGNSGGPLCNLYGQVIGINTAKISSSSYEGMGFAIPASTVKEIVDDLISGGYVKNRVRLGIAGTAVTPTMQDYYEIPGGILIGEVSKDGPCDNKGLEVNDIITAIDDEKIESFSDVYAILAKHKPGDKVVLSVYKMEQKDTEKITITLAADQGETQQ